MGEVFLADDTRLHRKIALKLLPLTASDDVEANARLLREATAAATLDHPNICSIYDIGEDRGRHFIVMAYVEGETLDRRIKKRPLELEESLALSTQVADALAEAHRRGVVHRDIKPANIMITPLGVAKVMDFGLARLDAGPVTADAETEPALTAPGLVMGTLPYMSPEQVRGERVDASSDIFSFGVTLYEALTGRQPFASGSAGATASAILTLEPSPITRYTERLPDELNRIVRKCLEKDRRRRYESARELASDLHALQRVSGASVFSMRGVDSPPRRGSARRWVGAVILGAVVVGAGGYRLATRTSPRIESLAILPFENAGADPEIDYLSDGIPESLARGLSKVPHLRMIAMGSVRRYKNTRVDPRVVGRDLAVRAILMGHVVPHGDMLSINVELVDTTDGRELWSDQYTRKLGDVLALEGDLSRQMRDALRLQLNADDEERSAKRATENAAAYQLYLKGRFYWNKRTPENLHKSIRLFQQAIDLDPNYALAYSGIADCYVLLGYHNYGAEPPGEALPKARAAAERAVTIDPELAEGHTSLANAFAFEWNQQGAVTEFTRAIALNPNYATAHQWYGLYLVPAGKFDEGLAELRRAQQIDPLSLIINQNVGWMLYIARRYDEAIEQQRKTLELDSHFHLAFWGMGLAHVQKHMYAQAIAAFTQAQAFSDDDPVARAALGFAYAAAGDRENAERVVNDLIAVSRKRYFPPYQIAMIYGGLGDKDRAFEWLEKAYTEHSPGLTFLKTEPMVDGLRTDSRFKDLIRRVERASTKGQ
jgi:serine/threonine-protein kinase